jgi:hypothetical protein
MCAYALESPALAAAGPTEDDVTSGCGGQAIAQPGLETDLQTTTA